MYGYIENVQSRGPGRRRGAGREDDGGDGLAGGAREFLGEEVGGVRVGRVAWAVLVRGVDGDGATARAVLPRGGQRGRGGTVVNCENAETGTAIEMAGAAIRTRR
jgi:hypothetical protein